MHANGTHTIGSSVSTGWVLDSAPPGFIHLDGLAGANAPAHTIIGFPNSVDSTIAGNASNNPFLYGGIDVSFNLSVPDVTEDTMVKVAYLSFGLTPGDDVLLPLPGSAAGGLLLMGGLLVMRKVRMT